VVGSTSVNNVRAIVLELIFSEISKQLNGKTLQLSSPNVNITKGASTKIRLFAWLGITISLATSFKPSASGCNNPQKPTTFGPLRR